MGGRVQSVPELASAKADSSSRKPRGPYAATYEDMPAHEMCESLSKRESRTLASRVHGSNVGGGTSTDSNPFMNRFFLRRDTGGFYAGSSLAAPKVTGHAPTW